MKKAVILYNSKTGTTEKYAEEIGKYIEAKGIDVQTTSIQKYSEEMLDDANFVFLGCWTSGLMIMMQHPEQVWKDFAEKLPNMPNGKLVLFTTYKILTGSMFRKMQQHLNGRFPQSILELKSRNGLLSVSDQEAIDKILS
jgi:flavodoxin